jgi:hypothetical protein
MEVTNIGLVDVAIDDITYDVAAGCRAHVVRRRRHIAEIRVACAEQFDDLSLLQPHPALGSADDSLELSVDAIGCLRQRAIPR